MEKRKKVLVAPLDWGLGHATRCIPIIKSFLEQGAEVIIAADDRAARLLKEEFPSLNHIHLHGYRIRYSKTLGMVLMIALQIPKILLAIWKEHQALKKIIREEQLDIVISDNRYGLWNKGVKCIFMTHQLMVKCPPVLKYFEPLLHRIILWFIKKYDECWVPDVANEKNLSGDLSHKYPFPSNAKFIGWLSRFNPTQKIAVQKKYDLLVLLSGTEPQRTVLENILTNEIGKTNYRSLIVRGVPEEKKQLVYRNNLSIVSYLNSNELFSAINDSETIISRPGYSTLMDLAATGKKAILIPTPGQTEQEYLAETLSVKSIFFSVQQKKFSLTDAIEKVNKTPGIQKENFSSQLREAIVALLKK
jgi:uncharacterized protein (TIGR00661 family)